MSELISLDDIAAAAERIAGVCVRTPLVPLFGADARDPLLLKPENLQPTGAFKLRGATNAIALLSKDQRRAGVVTHSSGNHGQALAYAARATGVPCTVVMPEHSTKMKVEATRRWGAEVVMVPVDARDSTCSEIAERTGAQIVPPFDDARIIAGQGTVGRELVADLPGVRTVLVPVGGGGLVSGVAAAVKGTDPTIEVVGVEPELAGDAAEGFAAGAPVTWSSDRTTRTMADGLHSNRVGDLNWAHISALVDDIVTVSEDQIAAAVRTIATRARLVAEPSGAVATAAFLPDPGRFAGPVVAVLSGGNLDPDRLSALLR